ncbi:hypothetical protein NDU88_009650 [Pleurodeles waltl]|uniref:Reverse transcriptase zinc-binding domain-containing protein n=1 Tax=Pleurodeles waltl TaxID=8319 RepID=A0AAV7S0B1_PLEWA|nr:hypothetical protein NDU88_009650 [Pleurodeles waltl]
MPRTLCAGSTDRCGRFSVFWWSLPGSGPQRQAPVGPARTGERGARSRPALLSPSAKRDSRRFLAILVGVWGVWDARMAPKIIRTPRSLRARQNQDPGGTRKDKKLPVPGSKEHSNLHVKGGPHKTTDMEKDARTMVQNHEQTQRESRKMKAASRQLQLSIKKVVKSCQDIGVRIATMETRTEELEIEVKAATAQTTTQGQQISDIQWKLEDAENRQRRNNLRPGQDALPSIYTLILGKEADAVFLRILEPSYYKKVKFKIRAFLLTSMTQGWHTDKIKLMEVSRHPTSCGIKNLYPLLLNAIEDDLAPWVKKWEARVGAKETEVCESMEMARTVLVSAGPQAQHFMVLYNLYYTPAKIASWGKMAGIMCPRCGCPKADLCHMFFQCVKLGSLITGISDILKKILKQTIYLTPQMVLLGVVHSVCNSRDRYFLFIAMSVFRNCIASLWRDVDPPRFNQWFSQLLSMYHLENSLYELKGAVACKRFTRAWAPLSVWLLGPENVPTK